MPFHKTLMQKSSLNQHQVENTSYALKISVRSTQLAGLMSHDRNLKFRGPKICLLPALLPHGRYLKFWKSLKINLCPIQKYKKCNVMLWHLVRQQSITPCEPRVERCQQSITPCELSMDICQWSITPCEPQTERCQQSIIPCGNQDQRDASEAFIRPSCWC